MKPDAIGLLFGDYRREILRFLFARPDQDFHVREIARQTGVPVGSLHRELRALADAGILRRTPAGRQVRYRANRHSPVFEPLAALFGRRVSYAADEPSIAQLAAESAAAYDAAPTATRQERVLARLNIAPRQLSAFARRHRLAKVAFFGSVTRDDFRPESDVDVLVEFSRDHPRDPFARVDIGDELSAMFGGRKVDVATSSVFRNPFRRASIERDLVMVHGGG